VSFAYRRDVELVAARHSLDPDLIQAMCEVESSGQTDAFRYEPAFWNRYLKDNPAYDGANPRRVSASYGLLQIMFPRAVDLGMRPTEAPEYLFVPLIGLDWGCRAFQDCYAWARFDIESALAAYNGGKTKDNRPDAYPKRNQVYADKVLKLYADIQRGRLETMVLIPDDDDGA